MVATIGPVTADAAVRYGITPQVTPATSTMPGLVDALVAEFTRRASTGPTGPS
jgi:uroporphyrinogen-III synthase